jgi:hypothetical protein
LALVVIGGLVTSTLLTLVVVPVLYRFEARAQERRGRRREARLERRRRARAESLALVLSAPPAAAEPETEAESALEAGLEPAPDLESPPNLESAPALEPLRGLESAPDLEPLPDLEFAPDLEPAPDLELTPDLELVPDLDRDLLSLGPDGEVVARRETDQVLVPGLGLVPETPGRTSASSSPSYPEAASACEPLRDEWDEIYERLGLTRVRPWRRSATSWDSSGEKKTTGEQGINRAIQLP